MTALLTRRPRITLVVLLAALALAAVLISVWLGTGSADDPASPAATLEETAAELDGAAVPEGAASVDAGPVDPTTPPTDAVDTAAEAETEAEADAKKDPEILSPASFDEQPEVPTASVAVVRVDAVSGEARGPGQVAGPALRFEIEVTPAVDLDLSSVVVTAGYGPDAVPASELSGPGFAPLTGKAESGVPVTGRYVFAVPEDARDDVTLLVTITADDPVVVFTGPVSTP